MEQIMVTPITPTEFILGKTLPFALIGLVDVTAGGAVGVFWFEVPMRGNIAAALLGHRPVPDDDAGDRAADLDRQPDAAAGHDEDLFLFLPGGAAFRLRVSRWPTCPTVVQWMTSAIRCAIFWWSLRASSSKGWAGHALAADARAGGDGGRHAGRGRPPVPQDAIRRRNSEVGIRIDHGRAKESDPEALPLPNCLPPLALGY